MSEFERTVKRYENEKDPVEKAHLKSELDKMPITSGDLEQVQQREADRKAEDIRVFNEKRKR